MELDRAGYVIEYKRVTDQATRILEKGYKDWALGAMALLEESEQAILLEFLLGKPNLKKCQSTPLEESLDWFLDELSTGSRRAALRQTLANKTGN